MKIGDDVAAKPKTAKHGGSKALSDLEEGAALNRANLAGCQGMTLYECAHVKGCNHECNQKYPL